MSIKSKIQMLEVEIETLETRLAELETLIEEETSEFMKAIYQNEQFHLDIISTTLKGEVLTLAGEINKHC